MASNSLPIKDHLQATAVACKNYAQTTLTAVSTGLAALIATKADKPTRIPFTIDAAAWTTGSGIPGYPYWAAIEVDIAHEQDVHIELSTNTLAHLTTGICPGGWTSEGQIFIYADEVPSIALGGTYTVINQMPAPEQQETEE